MKNMATGQSTSFSWDYSRSDILNIHKTAKKVAGSAELGDFTVDFDKDGSVVGVEIINASEFFSQLGITREQLEMLQGAEFSITKKDVMVIWIKLKLTTGVQTIPLPAPIVAEV